MRPVVLSGFMGTGKSTVGPAVAAKLGVPFVDTDAEIERAAGMTIAEIWRKDGEAGFRARESDLVTRLLGDARPRVIAVGGGALTREAPRKLATDCAIVVTLVASPETSVARAAADLNTRPNLVVGGDPVARAGELLRERREAYAECHLAVSTETLDVAAVTREIVACAQRDPLLVPLGTRSYTVDVCVDEPSRVTDALRRCVATSFVVVSDSQVLAARGEALQTAMSPLGSPSTRVVLEPGEIHKTMSAVSAIWDAALSARVDRAAVVVAYGGGVVGDLAGFAASSLLRGVRFVQIPTTLLAMVDSSVGGKTGCDHAAGKNLIGAFHQPQSVVADVAHLTTLDPRQTAAGLAEAVKIAVATDLPLFEHLEHSVRDLTRRNPDALATLVRLAVRAKIRVVRDDEREEGRRALLNVGHTVGHAIEAFGGFDRWLHGEAVAIGTVAELRATTALGWTEPGLLARVERLFAALGLPTHLDADVARNAWPYALTDKKRGGSSLKLPVVTVAGAGQVRNVEMSDLQRALLGG